MISEDGVALMVSTAYSIPSLIDIIDILPIVDRNHVIRMIDMFIDEAIMYIKNLGVKPLSTKYIKEDAYILCNDLLNYIGEFEGGFIPQPTILKYISRCGKAAILHSHPIPMPIPTIEDLMSSYQIGYNVECVISKSSDCLAVMICLEPLESWKDTISALYGIDNYILKSINYIVVGDDSQIEFLPFPNTTEQNNIIQLFIETITKYAKILYARIDLVKQVYDVEIFN